MYIKLVLTAFLKAGNAAEKYLGGYQGEGKN